MFISTPSYTIQSPHWYVFDRPRRKKSDRYFIKDYFDKNYNIFIDHLEKFRHDPAPNAKEEKELKFMLDELISTKRINEDR